MNIHFFQEDVAFAPSNQKTIQTWINEISKDHQYSITELNYIFCSDDYLLKINQEYLNHDYFTDIITFDNSEEPNKVEGDIFISIDRVKDNASVQKTDFLDELHRVIIHGLLHLIGYDDKSPEEKKLMNEKEDACLSLLPN